MFVRTLLLTVILLWPISAAAAAPTLIPHPVPAAEKLFASELPQSLDGRLAFAYRLARNAPLDPDAPPHPLLGRSVTAKGLRVTLQLQGGREVGEVDAEALASEGCELARLPDGALANVGAIVEADCTWDSLHRLAEREDVARVAPTFGFRPLPPSVPPSTTARDVEAEALRRTFGPLGRGDGVVVADVDSGFDPFHPMFFRADGGAFAWIDVNGNGTFDPFVDAVDFDGDGAAGQSERLGVLKAPIFWFYGPEQAFNTEPTFVAGVDWLFLDENLDGQRNYGPIAPYGDARPTFGEQLFVADDVNGNGKLDVGEKLIRLHTPKVKAALHVTPQGQTRVYRRGVDLARFPTGDAMHGTMVMGTIAGGDPRYMKYAGLAPDAELLLAQAHNENLVSALAWARQEGAHIVLWEMATWYMEFLDGSSAHELACDTASQQGVVQVGAAGNLGGSQKHRVRTHAPQSTETVPLVIPGGQTQYVLGNFLWRGSMGQLSFQVQTASGPVTLSGASGQAQLGNDVLQWQRAASQRGTQMLLFYLLPRQGGTMAGRTLEFSVTNSGAQVELHGYVTDSYSSWGLGVHWPLETGATDRGTYGTPGVGDHTIAVGTQYLDFVPEGETAGALASHSGQGPRIDGMDTVDFVAPEDHVTAITMDGWAPHGALMVGGGTSNASPVAVGVMAALKGLRPHATPGELGDLLRDFALSEPQMGPIPNDRWGYGKIRGFRAHHDGVAPRQSAPPSAVGTAQRRGEELWLDASGSSDPEGEPLRYFWDVDYDGTFEPGPVDAPVRTLPLPPEPVTHARLRVVDPQGFDATVLVPLTDGPPPTDGGTPPPDGGSGPGGGGVIVPEQRHELGPAASGCAVAVTWSGGGLWALVLLMGVATVRRGRSSFDRPRLRR